MPFSTDLFIYRSNHKSDENNSCQNKFQNNNILKCTSDILAFPKYLNSVDLLNTYIKRCTFLVWTLCESVCASGVFEWSKHRIYKKNANILHEILPLKLHLGEVNMA